MKIIHYHLMLPTSAERVKHKNGVIGSFECDGGDYASITRAFLAAVSTSLWVDVGGRCLTLAQLRAEAQEVFRAGS